VTVVAVLAVIVPLLVGGEFAEDQTGHDTIEGGNRQTLTDERGIHVLERNAPRKVPRIELPLRFGEHVRRDIDSRNVRPLAGHASGEGSGAASDFEHTHARLDEVLGQEHMQLLQPAQSEKAYAALVIAGRGFQPFHEHCGHS